MAPSLSSVPVIVCSPLRYSVTGTVASPLFRVTGFGNDAKASDELKVTLAETPDTRFQ